MKSDLSLWNLRKAFKESWEQPVPYRIPRQIAHLFRQLRRNRHFLQMNSHLRLTDRVHLCRQRLRPQ